MSPASFCLRLVFEAKIWALGLLTATGVSLLQLTELAELGNTRVCTPVCLSAICPPVCPYLCLSQAGHECMLTSPALRRGPLVSSSCSSAGPPIPSHVLACWLPCGVLWSQSCPSPSPHGHCLTHWNLCLREASFPFSCWVSTHFQSCLGPAFFSVPLKWVVSRVYTTAELFCHILDEDIRATAQPGGA